jgi:hypothetical protein
MNSANCIVILAVTGSTVLLHVVVSAQIHDVATLGIFQLHYNLKIIPAGLCTVTFRMYFLGLLFYSEGINNLKYTYGFKCSHLNIVQSGLHVSVIIAHCSQPPYYF